MASTYPNNSNNVANETNSACECIVRQYILTLWKTINVSLIQSQGFEASGHPCVWDDSRVGCCLHTHRNDCCHWVGTSVREGKSLVSFSRAGVILTLKGEGFQVAFSCPVFSGSGLYPATTAVHITRGRASTLPCLSPRFHLFGFWQIPLSEGGHQLSW